MSNKDDFVDEVSKSAPPIQQQADFAPEPQQVQSANDEIEQARIDILMRALSDEPTTKDCLNYKDYAQALTDFIVHKDTVPPLTIAIDAPWGSGKTSLMKMMCELLEEKRVPVVWFNAWQYDNEESIWAALAHQIIKQTVQTKKAWQQIELRSRLASRNVFQLSQLFIRAALIGVIAAGVVGLALTVGAALIREDTLPDAWNSINEVGTGISAIIWLLTSVFTGFRQATSLNLNRYMKNPNYEERLGFLHEFREDFERILETVITDSEGRLVIFIDDLDRCQVDSIAEIIEAINVFLDAKYCVFVLGMDMRTVAAALNVRYQPIESYLSEYYQSGASLGDHFLEKIVQITFRIPSAQGVIDQFLRAQFHGQEAVSTSELQSEVSEEAAQNALNWDESPEVQAAVKSVVRYLDYNPRRVKRFINLFRLQSRLSLQQLNRNDIEYDLLAKWLVVAALYPDFWVRLRNDTEKKFIEDYCKKCNEYKKAPSNIRKQMLESYITDGITRKYILNKTLFDLAQELKDTPQDKWMMYVEQTSTFAGAEVPTVSAPDESNSLGDAAKASNTGSATQEDVPSQQADTNL